ncbi:MAG: phosphoadenylyl-sulfate reductase [Cyclobacteriaceae bacterium]
MTQEILPSGATQDLSYLGALNELFKNKKPEERISLFYQHPAFKNNRIVLTSSFGATAVYLLHLLHKLQIRQDVFFLNTHYHFSETLAYKNQLTALFDLHVIELFPEEWKNRFTREHEVWKSDPDLCCSVNKVEPMLRVKEEADIWMSGLMGWQNDYRQNLDFFQWHDGILKFYPIIDISKEEVSDYLKNHHLPEHPLKPLGYESIGCQQCTFKGSGRQGRWSGQSKTECGLHR